MSDHAGSDISGAIFMEHEDLVVAALPNLVAHSNLIIATHIKVSVDRSELEVPALDSRGRSFGGVVGRIVGGSFGGIIGGVVGRSVSGIVGGIVGRSVSGIVGGFIGRIVGGIVSRSIGGIVGRSISGIVGRSISGLESGESQ